MMRLAPRLRGLAQRGGTTVMILAVALVATAAAAAGPIYYAAARTSILRDSLATAPVAGRGYEANETGAVASLLGQLASVQQGQLATSLGSLAGRGLFAPPLYSIETTVPFPQYLTSVPLVWRSDVCAHLRIDGACPAARGQVIVSRDTAAVTGWHIGQQLRFPGYSALTITGLYALPDQTLDYWFGRGALYFPVTTTSFSATSDIDAMFATRSTLEQSPAAWQGMAVVDEMLNSGRITGDEVAPLSAAMTAFTDSQVLSDQQVLVSTTIPATVQTVESSRNSVAVPVVLITAQLLVLCLLLLFLAVTEAVEARGPEIALAKLRGRGAWSTVAFGLSEPVTLLALALPAGILAGWGATAAICHGLLRPGTPVVLPGLAWATAAAATAGGLAAAVLAARRTLRRPVLEEWRHSGLHAANRGWVVDAVLATGAAAALIDLAVSGQISSAQPGTLVLLVPGLLGLAVAVIASRLLPLGCKAAFARTGRGGGLGLFLALRHVARRPGGARTTIVLATAFALAAFAVSAWSVGRDNQQHVAAIEVGAPTVLTVSVPAGKDLSTIVARADPGGRMAAAVDSYTSFSSGSAGLTTLAVDPGRFAHVAAWLPGPHGQSLTALAPKLDPPAPQPVILTGDAVRLTVQVHTLSPPGAVLAADVTTGASPVSLGPLPAHGTVTLTGQLVGCPCVLRDLDAGPPTGDLRAPVSGSVTITRLQVHGRSGWVAAGPASVLSDAGHWRAGRADDPPDTIQATASLLTWQFSGRPRQDAILASVNRPSPLPAVVSAALVSPGQTLAASIGLDGQPLDLRIISAAAAVPGAPGYGVIVDRRYAELAAGENLPQASRQVWLASGAPPIIEPRLRAAGVNVLSSSSAASMAATFARQGPGLASVLFLADAAAAALLAASAAVLGLYLSARRRRYEYAALSASGVRYPALRRSVLTELGLVLGFGSVIGAGTGLLAAVVALPSVPEFLTPPPAATLSYVPSPVPLAVLLGAAAGLLVIAAVTASTMLIRGVSLDQLREAPA
jgi:putative ABC transport system permease protein